MTKISIRKLRTQSLTTLCLETQSEVLLEKAIKIRWRRRTDCVSMDTICPKSVQTRFVTQFIETWSEIKTGQQVCIDNTTHFEVWSGLSSRSMNGTHYRHLLISQSPNFLSWWWWRYWNNEQWGCLYFWNGLAGSSSRFW